MSRMRDPNLIENTCSKKPPYFNDTTTCLHPSYSIHIFRILVSFHRFRMSAQPPKSHQLQIWIYQWRGSNLPLQVCSRFWLQALQPSSLIVKSFFFSSHHFMGMSSTKDMVLSGTKSLRIRFMALCICAPSW
jgi:hypothetical protein